MIPQLIVTLLITVIAIVVVWQALQARQFAPFVPSNMRLLRRALESIPLQSDDHFIDIGCGDGRAVIVAAKKFHLRATGVEIAPLLSWWARVRTWIAGVTKNTTIIRGDLYTVDLSHYSIIYIFGLPDNIRGRLVEKLRQELKPNTWVLSYSFSLPDWQPTTIITDRWRRLMIYKVN